jgi:hypothetical protein
MLGKPVRTSLLATTGRQRGDLPRNRLPQSHRRTVNGVKGIDVGLPNRDEAGVSHPDVELTRNARRTFGAKHRLEPGPGPCHAPA